MVRDRLASLWDAFGDDAVGLLDARGAILAAAGEPWLGSSQVAFAPSMEAGDEVRVTEAAANADAADAISDPRTAGYVEGYLKPLGITATLDTVSPTGGTCAREPGMA